jgi:hypothetical protein
MLSLLFLAKQSVHTRGSHRKDGQLKVALSARRPIEKVAD